MRSTAWTERVSTLQVSAEFLLSHLWGNLPALPGRERMLRGVPDMAVSNEQSSSMMVLKTCCFYFFFFFFLPIFCVQSSTFPLEDLRVFYLQNEMQNDHVSAGQTGGPGGGMHLTMAAPLPAALSLERGARLFSGAYLWRRRPLATASVQQ